MTVKTKSKKAQASFSFSKDQYRLNMRKDFSDDLISSSVDGIFAFDKEFRYTAWNPAMERLTGVAQASVLNRTIFEVFPDVEKHGDDVFFRAAISGNSVLAEDREYINPKTNTKSFFETYFSPLKSASGDIIGGLGIVRDITNRKELEQKIAQHTKELEEKVTQRTSELERRLAREAQEKAEDEALLGSIGEAVIATDAQAKIMFINNQTEVLLGWRARDVLGIKIFSILRIYDRNHKDLPFNQHAILLAIQGGKKVVTSDYFYARKDGSQFPVSLTTTPVVLEGKIIGAVMVFRDITKEKEIDRVKSEFVSLASHQLRTPLATINWYAETLLSGKVPAVNEQQKKYLDRIYGASRRMSKLVHDLLNVSRIELGTFGLDPEPVKISDLMHDMLSEMEFQIRSRNLTVTERYEKGLPIVKLDRQLLHIVFQNLLSNAVKYTRPGGKIMVEIKTHKEHGEIRVAISDTGYGIPASARDEVFTKFFRADNVKEKDQDGTGLGLYIVKSLVNLIHGDIWFVSPSKLLSGRRRRNGTTFYVSIPINNKKSK